MSSASACQIGNVQWWLGPGVSLARAQPALAAALRQLESGAVNLRHGRRKELYRLELPEESGEFLLKLNRYERGAGRLKRLRRSKARRELAVAAALHDRGIATALPFAAGEARQAGSLRCCYLLIPVLDGVSDLRALWFREGVQRAARRAWATSLGHLVRRLHDAGLMQADFAPNNFLVRSSGDGTEILPIDFERARIRRHLGAAARRRMLAKLDRNLAGASATDRMRFLLAYADGDRRLAQRWWRRLTPAAARLAARDLARLRRSSKAGGRRIEAVAWNGWSGWLRRDAPEAALAEAHTTGPDAPDPPSSIGLLVEPDGALWCGSGGASQREARCLWAKAHLLWARGGLGPRPVACLTHGDELRLWLARDATSRTLLQSADSPEAQRAAIVLIDRLLALGRLDPWLSTRKIVLVRRPDGGLCAQLIDPSAFRAARPTRHHRRERARALLAQRLGEVQRLREILRESEL